jgi:general secretion pathway protein C
MREISSERPGIAQKTVVFLVTLAALTLLGLVLAYWTWNWFGPRVEPSAPLVAEQGGQAGSGHAMFGTVQGDRSIVKTTAGPVRLLGVVAATGGGDGYAVIQLDSREIRAVREGGNIAPGVQLAEVRPDHVILSRNGVRESLAWPQKANSKKP